MPASRTASTRSSISATSCAATSQPQGVAPDIQAQLANLNINATIDNQESTTFIDNANAGKLDGIHLLGWGADYPDPTNFLDFHFGAGASPQFGKKFDDITAALKTGASSKEERIAGRLQEG